jgi:hypothetical protein
MGAAAWGTYIWQTLRRRRARSLFAAAGFLLAASALILLSATTETTALRASQAIAQNWRPSYDLVVLPLGAQISGGQVIPADTLEGYGGGISLEQYAQIKQIPGVEVAAPIAFIGYVQLPSPLIQLGRQSLPPGIYRADWTLKAFNGQQQLNERQVTFFYAILSSCPDSADSAIFQTLREQHIFLGACGPNPGSPQGGGFTFSSIDTGTFLLAAIDPVEEEQLLHLSQALTQGRLLTARDSLSPAPPPSLPTASNVPRYELPLLFQQHLPGQISLQLSFSRVSAQEQSGTQIQQQGGFRYLASLPALGTVFQGNVPLVQNDPQRFSSSTLVWTGQGWQTIGTRQYGVSGNALRFLYAPSGLTYEPVRGPNGQPAYALVVSDTQTPQQALPPGVLNGLEDDPATEQGPEPFFRTLSPLVLSQPQAIYFAQPVGQFDAGRLSAQFADELNWLPETTYAAPPVVLRYDAHGRPLPPTTILPTTNLAGMILQPPLALTTLSAAARLKGDTLISVIRVRVSGVSGVSGANEASWKRIQAVARQIEQRTGLRVLVTLGSSPEPTLVYVPGLQRGEHGSTRTIAPLGWVSERWIAIGISVLYLGEVSSLRLLLLAAVLLVCLGYQVVTLLALLTAQRSDLAILSALGWRPLQVTRLFLGQVALLALLGGLGGLALALGIILVIGASPPWPIVLLTLPAMLLLAAVSALYPLWQLRRLRPVEILRTGSTISADRNRRTPPLAVPPLLRLAWSNLLGRRGRSLLALLSFFCSALLLTLMLDGLLAFRQALQGTLLGEFVLLQTAVPQLASAIFALLLTFLSVASLLTLQVRERWYEIGLLQALGWRATFIQRLLVQEGLTLTLAGTLPGVLVAAGLLWQRGEQSGNALPLVALLALLLMLLVAVLGTLPALRALKRLRVIDIMRSE